MKLREILKEGTDCLKAAGIDNADYDARSLCCHVYGLDTSELLMQLDRDICPGALGYGEPADIEVCPGDCGGVFNFWDAIEKRARHVPLQYILGYTYFMGFRIRVTPDVLIPRPDTETLAETVLALERDPDIKLLDLCTGSGCIAVSLKLLGGFAHVSASDIDAAALDTARGNAMMNNADIIFYQSNLFENTDGPYDVIVSNPPYIASEIIPGLSPEVRDFDPVRALDGGEDGLDFYRRISAGAGHGTDGDDILRSGGRLYLEIGYDQADAVRALLKEQGFCSIEVIKDIAGNDRVVYGRKA